MWSKLEARYASKTTSNKLRLLTDIMCKEIGAKEEMSDHIGELETVFNQLDYAGMPVSELNAGVNTAGSMKDNSEYGAVVVAIRTMDEENTTWETITTRLIDEYKENKENSHSRRAATLEMNIVPYSTKRTRMEGQRSALSVMKRDMSSMNVGQIRNRLPTEAMLAVISMTARKISEEKD